MALLFARDMREICERYACAQLRIGLELSQYSVSGALPHLMGLRSRFAQVSARVRPSMEIVRARSTFEGGVPASVACASRVMPALVSLLVASKSAYLSRVQAEGGHIVRQQLV